MDNMIIIIIAHDRVLHMMLDSNINIPRNTEESAHDVER